MGSPRSLSTRRDFRAVYRTGRRARRDGLTVFALRAEPERATRVGFAIPRQVGGAVARNRLRRRLRAAFGAVAQPQGWDAIVRADASAGAVPYRELEDHVREAVTDLGLGRGPE